MASVKGAWVFKSSSLSIPSSDIGKVTVNFKNPNYRYEYTSAEYDRTIAAWLFKTVSHGTVKSYLSDLPNATWDFGNSPQTVPDKFHAWLTANATAQASNEPTEITYNGTTTSVEAGKTATLTCNGKRAKTDIVLVFGSAGTITYNSTETAVEAGKTATLACAGKRMKTDVAVSL